MTLVILLNVVGLYTGKWAYYCDEELHENLCSILISTGVFVNILSFGWFLAIHFNMGYRAMLTFCRHPMYTGFLYHSLPIALLTLNWFVTLTWFVWVSYYFLLLRIPVEERILIEVFGD